MKTDVLLKAAAKEASRAYAPYSGHKVGAVLLCADGELFTGCNVENASYGLTSCAEQSAVCAAIAGRHRRDYIAMAIVALGGRMPYPCGACRQVLAEFCRDEFSIYVATADAMEDYEVFCLSALLPYGFKPIG
jgi:cytidine deaminase